MKQSTSADYLRSEFVDQVVEVESNQELANVTGDSHFYVKQELAHESDQHTSTCNARVSNKKCAKASKTYMLIHTNDRPFSCKICDKSFVVDSKLTTHVHILTGERPFSCDVCDKTFTKGCDLRAHMRTHTGERPFSCEVCYKKFTQRSHLRTHMHIHTGERPFSCKVCDKKFTESSNLRSHMHSLSHRRETF